MAKKKAAPSKSRQQSLTELVCVEMPADLVKGMDAVGITNREEYINFLVAASLLNYPKIWKDEGMEKDLQALKTKFDHQHYMR